jgi:hypothetical protein
MASGRKAGPKGEPPPAGRPAAKDPKAPRNIAAALGRKPSRKMEREMLLLETRRLRALFSEIAEHYVESMEGRIASAIEAMEAKPLPAAKVAAMLRVVRDLTVKPQKGRRKDLARIEKAAETLLKELEE